MKAQDFYELVEKMRAAQNKYYGNKVMNNLIEARQLERNVDQELKRGAEDAEKKGLYAGIISALAVVKLHGADTIFEEIVALCDYNELIEHAKREEELEFSGLDKYKKPAVVENTNEDQS